MNVRDFRLAMAGWMLLVLAGRGFGQTTWYVDDDNCPAPGSGTQGDPFCSIQRGIDESVGGDEVLVAPGTYNETINLNGKAITLRSSEGPDVTTIDASGLSDTVVRCVSGETPDTILEGFTITGAGRSPRVKTGGGMLIQQSSPTITECVFRDNWAERGGGMYNSNSHPMVSNCIFLRNVVEEATTGAASYGGGMYNLNSSPTVTNCVFRENVQLGGKGGAGMYNAGDSAPTVTNCTFYANIGRSAGMVTEYESNPTVSNCTFVGNVFGGMSTPGSGSVRNCIFWGNTAYQIMAPKSPSVISYSDIEGGFPGVGNIDADPLFVDAAQGDLRLVVKSPCSDAGDNAAVPEGITSDLAGNSRFVDTPFTPDTGNGTPPIVDMGAFEFQGTPEFIPTLSEWGLVVLVLLLLTGGTVVLRRPRRTSRTSLFAPRTIPALFGTLVCASPGLGQVVVGPQIRIDWGGDTAAANETSIASSNFNPDEIVAAWNDWRDPPPDGPPNRVGVGVSMDGGATWTDFLIRPPEGYQGPREDDPMTAYDDRTGTLWVGGIARDIETELADFALYVARKDPGQNTFQPSVVADWDDFPNKIDKGWMAAGPAPGDPNATRLYIAYNVSVSGYVVASANMGEDWTDPVSVGFGPTDLLPRVGPNGELYVVYWDYAYYDCTVFLKRSFNGGVSFEPFSIPVATRRDIWDEQTGDRFPGTFRVSPMTAFAVDQNDGTLYCVYFDSTNFAGGECPPHMAPPNCNGDCNIDLYFTRSTDQGWTWTTPVVINGDAEPPDPPGDQFWPWIEVDERGNLHMVFLDSRHTPQADNVVNGMFDAYYAFSNDRGDTWQEFRLTPASFDSNNDGLNQPNQFLGDYLGLGRGKCEVYPCYLSTQNGDPDIYMHVVTYKAACCLPPDPRYPLGHCEQTTECYCDAKGGLFFPNDTCGQVLCPTQTGPQPGG